MNYKAVIFDLDGTLLDTLEDLADSCNSVLQIKGFPTHSIEAYRNFVGSGAAMLVSRALPDDRQDDDLKADCLKAFIKEYEYRWKEKTMPYKEVPEMLDALVDKNIKMTVLSNKPHDFTKLCVKEFFPKWKFAIVQGHSNIIPLKPDPKGACEIARSMNILPCEFLYLGDSGIDMITAVRAGMFPVGALWGFRSEEELRKNGALKVINRPTDVLNFI